jgi:hypothetical protein
MGDRDIELMRLHLMDTRCCRKLDVSNRSTYKKNKIFKSAELKIYRYLCKNCEDTFGFYVNGCIPEDIENFLDKLPEQPIEILTPRGGSVAELSWDTVDSRTAIMFWYRWSWKYGSRKQQMPIFQEGRTKVDIWGGTISQVDCDTQPTDPDVIAKVLSDIAPQFKDAGKAFPGLSKSKN